MLFAKRKLCLVGSSVTERTDNIPHLGVIMSGLIWLSFAGGYLSYLICEGLLFPVSHPAPGIQAQAMDVLCICPWLWMKRTDKCSSLLILTCSWTLLRGSLQNVPQISAGALSKSLYFQGTPCCSCSQVLSLVPYLVFWDTVQGAACWEYSSSQRAMRIIQTWPINWNRFFHWSARGYSVFRCFHCFSYSGLILAGHWVDTWCPLKLLSYSPPHMDRDEKI